MDFKLFKVEVYIPYNFTDKIRESLNEIGACRTDNYDNCLCIIKAKGTFRPLKGSDPYLGFENELCEVLENKIETLCTKDKLKKVVEVIKSVHPYDEPLINIVPLVSLDEIED